MDEFSLEQKSVDTEYGKIFYFCRTVSSDAPTVLLLHGLSSNHTTWTNMIRKLSKMHVNFIAPDLRGHGLSDKTRSRELSALSRMSADLELILEKEKIDKVIVVGYSWGGYITIDYAITHKERVSGLVLISASHVKPFFSSILSPVVSLYRLFLVLSGYLFIWQKRKKYHYFVHGKVVGYFASTFSGLATMPLSINFWMLARILDINYSDTAGVISCPTLIMYGESDGFIKEKEIQDLHKRIKRSEIVYMKNKGHYLGSWHQDEVAEYTANFIEKNHFKMQTTQ